MKRARYTYNEHNYKYERITFSSRKLAKRLGHVVVSALVVSTLFLVLSEFYWDFNPEELKVKHQNHQLMQELSMQSKELTRIELALEKLHKNENSFYRSLLNVEPMDVAVWNGGVGGSMPENASIPAFVRQLNTRLGKLDHKMNLHASSLDRLKRITYEKAEELAHLPAIKPVSSYIVSNFGYRHNPFHGHSEFHAGLDFKANTGTPIRAVGDGVVRISGSPQRGYGIQVELDHGYGFRTKYAHLSRTMVQIGDSVKRNDIIGLSGNTGYSTGPHLHYEVIRNNVKVNPIDYFYSD